MRDYCSALIKLLENSYGYYEQAESEFEKYTFKELYKKIRDITKHNDEDYECSINNITIVLSSTITLWTLTALEPEEKLIIDKIKTLLEIILEIYPKSSKICIGEW